MFNADDTLLMAVTEYSPKIMDKIFIQKHRCILKIFFHFLIFQPNFLNEFLITRIESLEKSIEFCCRYWVLRIHGDQREKSMMHLR